MSKIRQDQSRVPEVDTHKNVLAQRDSRKDRGRRRHENKSKKDTKWFDRWD